MTRRARWTSLVLLAGVAGCAVYAPEVPCTQQTDCGAASICGGSGFCVTRPDAGTPENVAPASEIVDLDGLSPTSISVTVRLVERGNPRATSLGACTRSQDDLRCASEPIGTRDRVAVEFAALEPGAVVAVYPAVWVDNAQHLGEPANFAIAPPAPTLVAASDGSSPSAVSVSWTAARGADEYSVYRDGNLVGTTDSTSLIDTGATAGGTPGAPAGVTATQGTRSDGIEIRWTPVLGGPGNAHSYTVVARGAGGVSPESAADDGNRGPYPIVRFEVTRDDQSIPTRVERGSSYVDTDAPPGYWTLAEVAASRGTDADRVVLTADAEPTAGAEVVYSVAATNEAGTSLSTSSNAGWAAAPPLALRWRGTRLNGPENQLDEFGEPGAAALDWEFETSSTTATVDDAAPGEFVYFLAQPRWADSAGPWQLVDVGWRAECGDNGACGEGRECHEGLCAAAGFRRVQSHTNWVGWADRVDYRVVGYYRPFPARFPDAFELAATEVTQGAWLGIFGTNPSFHASCGLGCPVENVSWYSALQYTNELSTAAGLSPCFELSDCTGAAADGTLVCESVAVLSETGQPIDCEGYRLPHELEFELGARGGTRPLPLTWIDGARCGAAEPYYEAMSIMAENSWRDSPECVMPGRDEAGGCQAPWPVGSLDPNEIGLFDMHGNVSEWVWDREWNYSAAYDAADFGEVPPISPELSGRVGARGGRFSDCFAYTVPSVRRFEWPQNARGYIGFRLARTLP